MWYISTKRIIILLLFVSYITGCLEQKQEAQTYNNSIIPQYSPVVKIAIKDLSERLKIPAQDITLVKEEPVEWPDSSLGYPKKGMMYTQVITPGYRIILKAGDKLYEYHSDYKRVAGPEEIADVN